jgi:hypothetical protein
VLRWLRSIAVAVALGALLAPPLLATFWGGLGPGEIISLVSLGLRQSMDHVGWVLLPQLILAVAVVGLFLRRVAAHGAGLTLSASPAWLDAAIESALLLGMLGTMSGMVSGFAGLSPDELEPGPLLVSLGTALRSSLVGFTIALIGVWARVEMGPVSRVEA